MLEPLPPSRVLHEWGEIGRQLARISKHDPDLDLDAELKAALSGVSMIWRAPGGYVVTRINRPQDSLRKILRITHAVGTSTQGLRKAVKGALADLEQMARTGFYGPVSGCKCAEIRIGGRKGWGRFLTEYETRPRDDGLIEYVKVL